MKAHAHSPPRLAVCFNNTDYPASLELHKIYWVLPDEDAAKDDDLRVIDESGEDYLYPIDFLCSSTCQRLWNGHHCKPLDAIRTA
jgi:hypothetical protein